MIEPEKLQDLFPLTPAPPDENQDYGMGAVLDCDVSGCEEPEWCLMRDRDGEVWALCPPPQHAGEEQGND